MKENRKCYRRRFGRNSNLVQRRMNPDPESWDLQTYRGNAYPLCVGYPATPLHETSSLIVLRNVSFLSTLSSSMATVNVQHQLSTVCQQYERPLFALNPAPSTNLQIEFLFGVTASSITTPVFHTFFSYPTLPYPTLTSSYSCNNDTCFWRPRSFRCPIITTAPCHWPKNCPSLR